MIRNIYQTPSLFETALSARRVMCVSNGGVQDLNVNPTINGDEDCDD